MVTAVYLVYMCTYVRQFFVFLPTFLFVRALFGKTVSTRTHEARLDTMVEVSARSVHSGARDGRSKFYFRREWISWRFPWFQFERPRFVRRHRSDNNVVSFPLMSCEHTTAAEEIRIYTRHTADIMHRSHRYNVVAHTPQYCCGWLYSSEPAVRIPQSALIFFMYVHPQVDVRTSIIIITYLPAASSAYCRVWSSIATAPTVRQQQQQQQAAYYAHVA